VRRRFPPGVLVAVALGGAAGTLLRAGLAQAFPPAAHGFPADTWIVNLVGSLILGFVVVTAVEPRGPSRYVVPLIGTGFCGGLTTFSTFAVEVDLLLKSGRIGLAAAYVVASVAGGLAAAALGAQLARRAWSHPAA
jgi:CrcB protein